MHDRARREKLRAPVRALVVLSLLAVACAAAQPQASSVAPRAEDAPERTEPAPPRAHEPRGPSVCDTWMPLGVRFRFGTGAPPVGVPALGPGGELYAGTVDGIVHALGEDGSYRWSYTLGGPIVGRGLVDSVGRVLAPTARAIYAITSEGRLSWIFNSPVEIEGPLVRDGDGRLRFASEDGRLFEFSERGALIRSVRASRPWSALPVVLPDGSVAAGTASGLVVVARGTGAARFELDHPVEQVLGCPGARPCAIAGGELVQLGDEAGEGSALPARRAGARGELVAVLSEERTLALRRGARAERVYEVTLPGPPSAAPAVDEQGRVYVPLASGALVAYAADGQALGCEQIARSELGAPLVTPRGTLLVTAREGLVAAVSLP